MSPLLESQIHRQIFLVTHINSFLQEGVGHIAATLMFSVSILTCPLSTMPQRIPMDQGANQAQVS